MSINKWILVPVTALALAACGSPAANNAGTPSAATSAPGASVTTDATSAPAATDGSTVARLDNVTLTRQQLDARVGRIQEAIAADPNSQGQAPSNLDVERSLVDLFVQEQLMLAVSRQRGVEVSDADVDSQIEQFRASFSQQGTTLEDAVSSQLGYTNPEDSEFRQFISYIVAQQKLYETIVTTDTVQTELEAQLQEQAKQEVEQVDVAHILVATEDEAKAVIERLNNGETFEALAAELSTDPGSAQNGGLYTGIKRGDFVPEFEKAAFEDLQPGETTQTPVQSQFGFHVIKLVSRGVKPTYTPEQIQEQLDQQLPTELDSRRQQAISELLDAERQKATDEGRLVVPTYPEPTPEVPGALPEGTVPDATAAPDGSSATEVPATDAQPTAQP